MNHQALKFALPAVFFVLIFLSGFWVSRTGKPYPMLPFTMHKLIGLAAGVTLGVLVYRVHKAAPLTPAQLLMVGVTVLLFILTVAAGGLVSALPVENGSASPNPLHKIATLAHHWLPYLALLSTGVSFYTLFFS